MTVEEILRNKQIKPSQKTGLIAEMLLQKTLKVDDLVAFAKVLKDAEKATCIEAIEYATKEHPGFATSACLEFVTQSLISKAPRVKWESARTIGNIAHLFPGHLDQAIKNLLLNTSHQGTVVRWSAAFALGQIVKLKTELNTRRLPIISEIVEKEEKNSIRKIYLEALKKVI